MEVFVQVVLCASYVHCDIYFTALQTANMILQECHLISFSYLKLLNFNNEGIKTCRWHWTPIFIVPRPSKIDGGGRELGGGRYHLTVIVSFVQDVYRAAMVMTTVAQFSRPGGWNDPDQTTAQELLPARG